MSWNWNKEREKQGELPEIDPQLASEKQRKFIWALCKQMELNPLPEVKKRTGKDLNDLTKREATALIDTLKEEAGA